MNYCLYLRKSRTDLEAEAHQEGDTLLRHEKLLHELADRLHLTITKTYKEIVSGETIAARPVMQKLLQEVEDGHWSGVLVMEIERLARGDTIDQGIVAQAFKCSKTQIITPLKIFDPCNEYDEEYFEFGLFMSRREFKTINRRIQRGRIASVKEGKFISSTPPYGYLKEKLRNEKGYTLIPHPEQSKVIWLIFEWYTKGHLLTDGTTEILGGAKIANMLNNLKYKPARADLWSKSSVLDILKNPVYIGYIRWQYRKEITNIKENRPIKQRKKTDEFLLVKGLHEPIIDDQTFQMAQKLLKEKANPSIPGNRRINNPLLGILYCYKCKKPLTRLSKNKKSPYDLIKCMNPACDNISSPLFLVEDIILSKLDQWLKGFTFTPTTLSFLSPIQSAILSKENFLKELLTQKNKKDKQYEFIHDLLEEGVYGPEEFIKRKTKIEKEVHELNLTYLKLQNELMEDKLQLHKTVDLPQYNSLKDLYYDLTSKQTKNELLKNLIEKVEYEKNSKNNKGEILRCNFSLHIYPKVKPIS